MRIAIAAEGTRGDVHPMLALAEHLVAAGHSVRFSARRRTSATRSSRAAWSSWRSASTRAPS
jgi:UDP:flavonoid glycosyltransferase YjiC (YdhE family)